MTTEISSRTALGGVAGDSTHMGFIIHKVFADGIYGWKRMNAAVMGGQSADISGIPAIADTTEGYEHFVESNGLTYIHRDGAMEIKDIQVTVANEAARDVLTEMVQGQRAYLADQDSIDTWDGTAWVQGRATINIEIYDDMLAPNEYTVGDKIIVVNDPDQSLNGAYDVLGAAIGEAGAYIDAA